MIKPTKTTYRRLINIVLLFFFNFTLVPGYARKFQAKKNPAKTNPTIGPLRSGRSCQKRTPRTDGTPNAEIRNPVPTAPVPEESKVTTTAGTEKLDIPWETIQAAQEADLTLQKIRELMWNPDPPQDVNEFGIDVVHLWSQRKSLKILNGVIHRNYETPDGLIEHRQILVPKPLRKRFLYWVHGDLTSGHFGVQKTQQNSNTMHIDRGGDEMWNYLFDDATLAADTGKVQHGRKVP